jgi:hypothetical protein
MFPLLDKKSMDDLGWQIIALIGAGLLVLESTNIGAETLPPEMQCTFIVAVVAKKKTSSLVDAVTTEIC